MRSRLLKTTLVAFVAMSGMAAQCMTITDPLVVSVNVKDIKDTYNVTTGTGYNDDGAFDNSTPVAEVIQNRLLTRAAQ